MSDLKRSEVYYERPETPLGSSIRYTKSAAVSPPSSSRSYRKWSSTLGTLHASRLYYWKGTLQLLPENRKQQRRIADFSTSSAGNSASQHRTAGPRQVKVDRTEHPDSAKRARLRQYKSRRGQAAKLQACRALKSTGASVFPCLALVLVSGRVFSVAGWCRCPA